MSTAFARKREPVASLALGPLLGVEALVDDDPAGFEPDRAEHVRVEADPAALNIEQPVQIVELDMKLQVLLDNILDRDRRAHLDASGVSELAEQKRHAQCDLRSVSRGSRRPAATAPVRRCALNPAVPGRYDVARHVRPRRPSPASGGPVPI
jgi:hypothetical protein